MAAETLDTVVIGSGFGGAVAAARLVQCGARVTLLERGPWRATDAVLRAGIESTAPLPAGRHFVSHALHRVGGFHVHRHGLFDLHLGRQLSVVCANGVGGGSHVYSAMNVRPGSAYWNGHHADIDDARMAPHYAWIESQLGSRRPDPARVPNALAGDAGRPHWMHVEGIEQPPMGFRFEQDCYANNSFFGSRDNAKVTLDEALLLPLLGRGLDLRPEQEVIDIARRPRGLSVSVRHTGSGRIQTLLARRLVLAAGTLNTLRLLFASRARGSLRGMPALGHGLSGNGDVPAWWPLQSPERDYTRGTPCHGRFALDPAEPHYMLTRFGFNGIDAVPLPNRLRRRMSRDVLLVAMGVDRANGVASWRNGSLHLRYERSANPVLDDIYDAYRRIGALSGTKPWFLPDLPVTVHPLGGARLARSAGTGVVNDRGEVHGVPGLYIADASALPAAPGVPPSITIAAWASHVAAGFGA